MYVGDEVLYVAYGRLTVILAWLAGGIMVCFKWRLHCKTSLLLCHTAAIFRLKAAASELRSKFVVSFACADNCYYLLWVMEQFCAVSANIV